MRKILCYIGLLLCCVPAFSQQKEIYLQGKLTGLNHEDIILEISTAAKKTKTLYCDFVQEKTSSLVAETAISKGKMYFKSPHSLRWEYVSPQASALIVNNNDVALKTANGTSADVNTRMLKELANIIISSIDGSGLNDSKNFSADLSVSDLHYMVELTPVNKRIAAVYSSIVLIIQRETYLADSIILIEKNGDKMQISFSNHKLNQPLDNKLFNVE